MHIRSFRIALLPIAAAVLGVLMLVSPAKAQSFPDNVCTPGPSQCLNLWNNNQSNGARVKFLHYGNSGGYNNWDITVIGHVVGVNCNSNCWPFDVGSGLNGRYNGSDVVTFAYWDNKSYCMDQTLYETATEYGDLQINPCAGEEDYQMFVWTNTYGWLVCVYASDIQYYASGKTNVPVWLGGYDNNTDDGNQVSISPDQAWGREFVFVSSGGSPVLPPSAP
jgi:hypothetical protein